MAFTGNLPCYLPFFLVYGIVILRVIKMLYKDSFPILDEFLAYLLTIKGRSKQTVYAYYTDLHLLFSFLAKQKKYDENKALADFIDKSFLSSVTYSDILSFLYHMQQEQNNSAKTQARKVSAIKVFFRYLLHNDIITKNPAEQLSSPSLPKKIPKHLSLSESYSLLSHVDGPYRERDFCILVLFVNCGMRLSELVGINMTDIGDDHSLLLKGKGNKERIIYLNQMCIDAIARYQKVKEKEFEGKPYDRRPLFLGKTGRRLGKRRIEDIVNRCLRQSGLKQEGVSVHKLRHTAATLMYQSGTDIRTLKEVLGHSNISTTQIYTHVSNQQIKKATENNPINNKKGRA